MKVTQRYILRDSRIRDRLKVYLDSLAIDPEKPLEVLIKRYKINRSLAQNNLMWEWLGVIVNHLRDEHGVKTNSEDLKHYLQTEYLGFKAVLVPLCQTDQPFIRRVIGTSELNTAQFTEFLGRIEVYANSELGVNLPHPADDYYEAMGESA